MGTQQTLPELSGNPVRALFDRNAGTYQQRSDAWPWRWIRGAEARAIASMLDPLSGETALDLGCGAGFYTRLLLDRGARHVTAVDFSSTMVSALPEKGVRGVVADALSLRLPERFRCIVSAGLLEFVANPLKVLETARYHADQRAVFVLLVPSRTLLAQVYRIYHRANGIDIRLFSASDLTRLASQSGWRVTRQQAVFPFAQVARLEIGSAP